MADGLTGGRSTECVSTDDLMNVLHHSRSVMSGKHVGIRRAGGRRCQSDLQLSVAIVIVMMS